MHWMLTPYDKHADDGFGAMASAFKASAETLMATEKDSIAQRELPTCFLLRHAAELFLKSVLIVSHRALASSPEPREFSSLAPRSSPRRRLSRSK